MKKLLSVFAALAVAVGLSGCQAGQTDTVVSETTTTASVTQSLETTAPESTDIVYETLAEGQERDWKIEDVLKNDLEIDGIPISIPCTVEELLDTLGEGYSVNDNSIICYNNKETVVSLLLGDTEDTIYGIYFKYYMIDQESLFSDKGILLFSDISNQYKYSEFLNRYTLPNEITIDNDKTDVWYTEELSYITLGFRKDVLTSVIIGFNTGENEK